MRLTKFTKSILITVTTIWLFTGVFIFVIFEAEAKSKVDPYSSVDILTQVLLILNKNYVEEQPLDKLVEKAVEGMISDLDPHTTFFTPEEFAEFTSGTKGEFGGLGITIDKIDEHITVVNTISGSPAEKVGLRPGDKFVEVEGKSVIGITPDKSKELLRGPIGSKVKIALERPGQEKLFKTEIQRDNIKIEAVPLSFMINQKNKIGYIKLTRFSKSTKDEMEIAISNLEHDGMRSLLLDLRSNPGGLLGQAVDVVDEFIDADKRVVFTKGKLKSSFSELYTLNDTDRDRFPIVILIDENTASAAEIVAGALQDWDQGIVAGTTSFGKGTVQTLKHLKNNYGMKYTSAKYYINSGRCIHNDIHDRQLRGEEFSKTEEDSLKLKNYETEYLTSKGRKVFGGGGIIPDIKIVENEYNNVQKELAKKRLFFKFAIDYNVANSDKISKDILVNDKLLERFYSYSKSLGFRMSDNSKAENKNWIIANLKAELLGIKYGEYEKFVTKTSIDHQLQEALKLFDHFSTKEEMFEYARSISEKL